LKKSKESKAISAKSTEPGPELLSNANSAMTVHRTPKYDIALSARSKEKLKSVREKSVEITAKRFEQMKFDADCQTGDDLLEFFLRKETN